MRCHSTVSLAVLLGAAVFQLQGCGDDDPTPTNENVGGTPTPAPTPPPTPAPTPTPEQTLTVTASMSVSAAAYTEMTANQAAVDAANGNFATGFASATNLPATRVAATSDLVASNRRLLEDGRGLQATQTITVTYTVSGSSTEIANLKAVVEGGSFTAALQQAVSAATGYQITVASVSAAVSTYVDPNAVNTTTPVTGNQSRRLDYAFLTEQEQIAVSKLDLLI